MKLTSSDIEELKKILAAAKVFDIEGIVIKNGRVSGSRISLDAAIISDNKLSISGDYKIGIGRVSDLDKRISVFTGEVNIEGKSNDDNDVGLLTITAGRSKMQFRCTLLKLIPHPAANDDPLVATATLDRAEVQQITRAAKTLGAEHVTLQVTRNGAVRFECLDSSNDKFEIELSEQVKYEDEETSLVQSYNTNLLVSLLDHAAKDAEKIELEIGEIGSLTGKVKGHTVVIFPLINGEE